MEEQAEASSYGKPRISAHALMKQMKSEDEFLIPGSLLLVSD